jgi:hypothetical protein
LHALLILPCMLHAPPRYIDLTSHVLVQGSKRKDTVLPGRTIGLSLARESGPAATSLRLGLRVRFHAVAVRHAAGEGGGGPATIRCPKILLPVTALGRAIAWQKRIPCLYGALRGPCKGRFTPFPVHRPYRPRSPASIRFSSAASLKRKQIYAQKVAHPTNFDPAGGGGMYLRNIGETVRIQELDQHLRADVQTQI